MPTVQYDRIPGDTATYVLGDAVGAVSLARSARRVAVDIETPGLGGRRWEVRAFSVGTANHAIVLDPATQGDAIRAVLEEAEEIVVHNGPFDIPILHEAGLFRLEHIGKVHDTLIDARLAHPGETVSKSLGESCNRWLGPGYASAKHQLTGAFASVEGLTKKQMFEQGGLDDEAYVAYAGFDIIMTARLREALPAAVHRRMTELPFPGHGGDAAALSKREQTVNKMFLARSCRGIGLDMAVVDALEAELRSRVEIARETLEVSGIDVERGYVSARTAVVARIEELGLLPPSWPRLASGAPTADKKWLSKVEHPLVQALRSWGEAEHFLRDYAGKLVDIAHPTTMRLHPVVNVLTATTGRMSYSSPPLQQFPASVRRMMRSETPITSFDWASIEPAFAANAAGDRVVVAEYEAGRDLYGPLSREASVPRDVAKTVLLATLYGQGAPALSNRLGVPEEEARLLRDRIMGAMPQVDRMIRRIRAIGDEYGVVITMSGRVIPLPTDPRTGNRRYLGYRGANYFIQGSCLDLLSEALVEMYRRGLSPHLFAAVHDEVVVSTSVADEVDEIMRTPPPTLVELAARRPVLRVSRSDLGQNWKPKEGL